MTERQKLAPPSIRPIMRIEGESFYSDEKGSIVDPEKLDKHFQLTLPLRNFVTEASTRADSERPDERQCALGMLLEWADAGAMTEQPSHFIGQRERQRYTIALNVIALKLQTAGLGVGLLIDWLAELSDSVIVDFAKLEIAGNLYVWSGVCAASFARLSGDDAARRYQNRVWQNALELIQPDGSVTCEIGRGARALPYHVYYLSALLMLRAFRTSLGKEAGVGEYSALARLIAFVGRALKDPCAIGAMAGNLAQECVPARHFAPLLAFGGDLLNSEFWDGAPPEVSNVDPILGGNLARTAAILAILGAHNPGTASNSRKFSIG